MTLSDEDITTTIGHPESRDAISLIGSAFTPFDVFDDVIVFIDDGDEGHSVVL
jgi:hypothetical protein